MKKILFISVNLIFNLVFGQKEILFNEPFSVKAVEKINSEIKKGDSILLTGIFLQIINEYPEILISAKKTNGNQINFDPKKINSFEFLNINNTTKVWEKYLLTNGSYYNLLNKGMQYELRNELNNEAVEYVNNLEVKNIFFNDNYFEDYLYTIINNIHKEINNDKRPGNLYVKVIKETTPNAFALPNGCLIITTGLLSTIQSEDELVGILAHEIAHFVLDHHILNYNKDLDRKKRAEFWSNFATVIAAGADVYLTLNNKNHIPGILTATTALTASLFSAEVLNRLSISYSQNQEFEADLAAQEILKVLKYDKNALSMALIRMKNYFIKTGNYYALTSSGTHPTIDSRIGNNSDLIKKIDSFTQSKYLKKASLINSYNAWIEMWYYAHYDAASELATRNIVNGVATESDYIIKAAVTRRINNSKESNEEVIRLLNKAKSLNVNPSIIVHKEEGITYLRLGKNIEAKKAFQNYLNSLLEFRIQNDIHEVKNRNDQLDEEITWTKKMIFKSDSL